MVDLKCKKLDYGHAFSYIVYFSCNNNIFKRKLILTYHSNFHFCSFSLENLENDMSSRNESKSFRKIDERC